MKTIYTSFVCLLLSFFLVSNTFGLDYRVNASLYNHLIEINKNWQLHQNEVPNELISFHSDRERIQMHLLLVEKSLRNTHSGKRTAQQNQNRETSLDILHTYALAGKFPINTGHKTRQPYFIDNFGTHCAVGFLVKETGFPEISKAISETQNFAYVKEIVSPELVKWSVEYGFSLEELAWIQPGYAPTQTYAQVGGGTNGTITCSRPGYHNSTGDLLFGGDFTELDGLPCLNVGYFSNNQLGCFGNGISGKIISVYPNWANGVLVVGEFEFGGTTYPMAKFDGNTWVYLEIPGVPNARATSFSSIVSGNYLKIAISAPSIIGGQEIWGFNNFQVFQWEKVAFVPGVVYDIDCTNLDVYAGKFDSVYVENMAPPHWVSAKNVIVYDYLGGWSSAIGGIPDTVYSICTQGNSIYLGGYSGTDSNGVALSRLLNGVSQPLITNIGMNSGESSTVWDIAKYTNGQILVGGKIPNLPQMFTMTYGRNLYIFDVVNSLAVPISLLDSTVRTIAAVDGKYYFGGDFTYNGFDPSFSPPLNHLIYLDGNLGIQEQMSALQLAIFPNPSMGNLSIQGIDEERIQSIEILDLQGKICHESQTTELDLAHLKSGTYLVRVVATDGSSTTKKWVKE